MNWDDLRVFLHVARFENLSRAAKQLRVDTSTVSRRISQLEYTLGFSVFERSTGGVSLNEQGRRLLSRVEVMGAGFADLLDELAEGTNAHSGLVRVGTMEGLASLYLTRHLLKIQKRHPNITLELVTSTQQLQVTRREADIFLGFFKPTGEGFDSERLGSFNVHMYASERYLLERDLPTLETLNTHHFVSYIDELIQIDAVRWLTEVLNNPLVKFHSNSMIAQLFAAAAGVGIVMLPEFVEAQKFGLVRVLEQEVVISRELWLSVHRELRYTARIKAVTEFLRELFTRGGAVYAH
ncbi:LysR family transcriptional regulator [Pseudomonas sp. RC10]|uniref:LysR family transcriptional regulator n=1 Tax=Pseudomonas bambusae TaxID=3139142 RepID=UPI0031396143